MSLSPSIIAGISLALLLSFVGVTTAHALEQAGVIGCAAHLECADAPQDPVSPCGHGACPHHVNAVLWTAGGSTLLAEAPVDHPAFTPLCPVGPVFDIDHPPQIG